MMERKKLDPKVPYEKAMIEADKFRQRDPVGFYKKVRDIMREWRESACRKIGIPVDTKLDSNLILATTEDDVVFFSRGDLIVYPGLKLGKYIKEVV